MVDPEFPRRLLAILRKRESHMLRLLELFVKCESPSDSKPAVDRFARLIASEWRRLGARIRICRQAHRGNHLMIEWPRQHSSRMQILVLGHLDTVYPLGTIAHMPFRVSRGRAFGPGSFDMKGGLVLALFAAEALASAISWRQQDRVLFFWTSDEEIGSETSRRLIEQEARRSRAVLVLEPAIGRDGRLKIQRSATGTAEITVRGRAAHAALNPEQGVNAIEELALQIARLKRLNRPAGGVTLSPTMTQGGIRSNVIPASARLTLDLRADTKKDMRLIERKLRRLDPILRGARIDIRVAFSRPPMERNSSAELFAKAQGVARLMGLPLRAASVRGGSDGNFTAALGIPTLDGLGAVGEGAHSPNENVDIRALPQRAALLASLLAAL